TSNPNPFTADAKLRFELNRMSYVTIEVFDLLGNKVYGSAGQSYEAGRYEIVLDGKTLPHGTLYARISTGFGEVKTVKLIHQE
ncbi:MAG: T9SS type A sorting domain-containing protein, partial [Candidatus Kapaibacterium sp.]